MGVIVKAGALKIGTPLCIPEKEVSNFYLINNTIFRILKLELLSLFN
jgi:hypothetical protein